MEIEVEIEVDVEVEVEVVVGRRVTFDALIGLKL